MRDRERGVRRQKRFILVILLISIIFRRPIEWKMNNKMYQEKKAEIEPAREQSLLA